jgi:hypothetical protein
MLVFMSRYV